MIFLFNRKELPCRFLMGHKETTELQVGWTFGSSNTGRVYRSVMKITLRPFGSSASPEHDQKSSAKEKEARHISGR